MLMYLTDGVEGGETHFPQVSWCTNLSCNQTEQSVPVMWSVLALNYITGINVPGRRGRVQLRWKVGQRTVC
jgi:hypothetical protein